MELASIEDWFDLGIAMVVYHFKGALVWDSFIAFLMGITSSLSSNTHMFTAAVGVSRMVDCDCFRLSH